MGEQTFIKMKKKLAIFLIVLFVLSITAVTASAAQPVKAMIDKHNIAGVA